MAYEAASTYAQSLINTLLHVHALTSMHRGSGNDEFRRTAAEWVPRLEAQLALLKRELCKPKDSTNAE